MKALVGAFNQEKALVGAFSVIVQPVVEPMDRFTALQQGDRAERRALRLPPLQLQPGPPEEGVGRHDGRGLQGRSPGGRGGEGGLMSGIL